MTKDQEIQSLQLKLSNLERDLETVEQKLNEHKSAKDEGETHKSTNDALNRKIALLEGELDTSEKQLRETTDKCVLSPAVSSSSPPADRVFCRRGLRRLRQVDVKAEHFERQVSRVEQERDSWEKKYEEAVDKYNASKRELEEVSVCGRISSTRADVSRDNSLLVLQLAQQLESI